MVLSGGDQNVDPTSVVTSLCKTGSCAIIGESYNYHIYIMPASGSITMLSNSLSKSVGSYPPLPIGYCNSQY